MQLEHVAIEVASLERAERFYVEGIGFERTRAYENDRFKTAFLRGDSGALLQLREPVGTDPERAASTVHHLGIVVGDIDAAFERVVETTACPVIERPRAGRPGVELAFVTDPDGTAVELIERDID